MFNKKTVKKALLLLAFVTLLLEVWGRGEKIYTCNTNDDYGKIIILSLVNSKTI